MVNARALLRCLYQASRITTLHEIIEGVQITIPSVSYAIYKIPALKTSTICTNRQQVSQGQTEGFLSVFKSNGLKQTIFSLFNRCLHHCHYHFQMMMLMMKKTPCVASWLLRLHVSTYLYRERPPDSDKKQSTCNTLHTNYENLSMQTYRHIFFFAWFSKNFVLRFVIGVCFAPHFSKWLSNFTHSKSRVGFLYFCTMNATEQEESWPENQKVDEPILSFPIPKQSSLLL